jgi:hypothetical protein
MVSRTNLVREIYTIHPPAECRMSEKYRILISTNCIPSLKATHFWLAVAASALGRRDYIRRSVLYWQHASGADRLGARCGSFAMCAANSHAPFPDWPCPLTTFMVLAFAPFCCYSQTALSAVTLKSVTIAQVEIEVLFGSWFSLETALADFGLWRHPSFPDSNFRTCVPF